MATVTRSFYAARGDYALHGLNLELARVPLTLDAIVDFQASRRNDGVQLSLFYTRELPLFLQVAAPGDGAWFLKNGFAAHVDLVFSAAVDKGSISNGTFTWRWDGGEETVLAVDVDYFEGDRQLRITAPTLPVDYVGSLALTFADVDSAETDPLSEVVSLHFDITEDGSAKAQPGDSSFSRPTLTGYLGVGRLVVPFGQNIQQMVGTFIEQKALSKEKILRVVQLEGPNKTVEIFLLWWQTTSPKLLSVTPRASGTLASESPPTSILLQFDQPVDSPAEYLEFDGVSGTNVSFTIDKLDDTGRQWRVVKSGGIFTSEGQHTLKIVGLPNINGDLPGPPMLFSWQVQPLMSGGGVTDHGALTGLGDDDHTQYVTLSPATTARNRIQPTADIIPLWIRLKAGQTADVFRLDDDTGTQPMVRIDAAGNMIFGGAPYTFPGGGGLRFYDTTGAYGSLGAWGANLPQFMARSSNVILSLSGGAWSYDDYFNPGSMYDSDFKVASWATLGVMKFKVAFGNASPESVVTAPPGSIYYQRDAGDESVIWVKATGTGNTGWANVSANVKSYADGLMSTHVAAADPHTQYQQQSSSPTWTGDHLFQNPSSAIRTRFNTRVEFLDGTNLIIAVGVITVVRSHHQITSQSGVTDDLDTITIPVGADGFILYLTPAPGHTITLKNGTGNIITGTGGDVVVSTGTVLLRYSTTAGVWHLVNGSILASVGTPAGTISMYGSLIAPTGYLLCDGTSYLAASYPALFAVVGYTFGGAGANFNVPDLRDRFPQSVGPMNPTLGSVGGAVSPAVTDPGHRHAFAGGVAGAGFGPGGGMSQTSSVTTGVSISDGRPPFLNVQYIIKI